MMLNCRPFLSGMISLLVVACGDGGESPTLGFKEVFDQNGNVTGMSLEQVAHGSAETNYDIKITSVGASSGYVKLNGKEIAGSNVFKNKDFEATKAINLAQSNTLEAFIAGQPGDQICIEILQDYTDHKHLIYSRCLDRDRGKPQVVAISIDLN